MRLDYISHSAEDIKKDFPDSDPFEMAKAMGNLLLFQAMGKAKSACKGFFMMQDGQPSITINSDLPKMIQKIICAHELGHAVLHSQMPVPIRFTETVSQRGQVWIAFATCSISRTRLRINRPYLGPNLPVEPDTLPFAFTIFFAIFKTS